MTAFSTGKQEPQRIYKKRLKVQEELEVFQKAVKYVKKEYGKDKCRGYNPDCFVCRGQILRGSIENHIGILEWELQELKESWGS